MINYSGMPHIDEVSSLNTNLKSEATKGKSFKITRLCVVFTKISCLLTYQYISIFFFSKKKELVYSRYVGYMQV